MLTRTAAIRYTLYKSANSVTTKCIRMWHSTWRNVNIHRLWLISISVDDFSDRQSIPTFRWNCSSDSWCCLASPTEEIWSKNHVKLVLRIWVSHQNKHYINKIQMEGNMIVDRRDEKELACTEQKIEMLLIWVPVLKICSSSSAWLTKTVSNVFHSLSPSFWGHTAIWLKLNLKFPSILILCTHTQYRPSVDSSWRLANIDVIPATGIMAFGKHIEESSRNPIGMPTIYLHHINGFIIFLISLPFIDFDVIGDA